jgi:hypothetical protein
MHPLTCQEGFADPSRSAPGTDQAFVQPGAVSGPVVPLPRSPGPTRTRSAAPAPSPLRSVSVRRPGGSDQELLETALVGSNIEVVDLCIDDGYPVPDFQFLDSGHVDAAFSGIIHHIWVSSGYRYNAGEITFIYKTICQASDCDLSYIFDYTARNRYGTGPSAPDQCFGVGLRRMRVCPVAYALRSDYASTKTNYLKSWAFQGRRSGDSEWVTLDEQRNTSVLCGASCHFVGYVRTNEWFQAFRVLQTGPSQANFFSFNLTGFEIHGWVHRNPRLPGRKCG